MSSKHPQHTKQFKLDAINYRKEHPNLTQAKVAENLGIGALAHLLVGKHNSEKIKEIYLLGDPVIMNQTNPKK